jgi:TetR/AcrR family transcriptional regulator
MTDSAGRRGDAPGALLEAAEALFASQGFAATTIKQIGAQAGVNPALIYYYFPDKLRLYAAVLDRRLGGFVRSVPARLPEGLGPLDGIHVIVRAQVEFMRSSPHLPRLLARELADHDAAIARPLLEELAAGPFRRFTALIREGQRAGLIREGLDPRFAAISILAQVAWFFIAQPLVSRILGHEGRVPEREVDRYTEHAVAFALAALAPTPAPGRARSRSRR